ncbi:hypothetical protein LCGC14_1085400, partial [marine sediment metagenome]
MGRGTDIEWATHTHNAWFGCTKVSPGCTNCYAEALMDKRWGKVQWGPGNERVRTSEGNALKPIKWNKWVADGLCGGCGHSPGDHGRSVDLFNATSGGACTKVRGKDREKVCECPGFVVRPRVFSASLSDFLDPEVPPEWL